MNDTKRTAEGIAAYASSQRCRCTGRPKNICFRCLVLEEIITYGDQRASEELKEFTGIICTCLDGPCGSGMCVSSSMQKALSEDRKTALELLRRTMKHYIFDQRDEYLASDIDKYLAEQGGSDET